MNILDQLKRKVSCPFWLWVLLWALSGFGVAMLIGVLFIL